MPQRAIIIKSQGVAALVDDHTVPYLRSDYILVKVYAVALNPTDWKHVDYFPAEGAIVGCDYAGVVLAVGNAVNNSIKSGDRVCGFVHGANSVNVEDGTFAEYIVAKGDLQMKIPSSMSYEAACGLGVGISTVGQGLFQSLRLPLPNSGVSAPSHHRTPLLVYGGSTATGTLAIQYAKLSGCEVFTTCSPANFDLVKGVGADHVFDYNSPTCAADIRAASKNALALVFDCISEGKSSEICAEAIGQNVSGAKYTALLTVHDFPRKDVETAVTWAYTAIGEAFEFPGVAEFDANPVDFDFGVKFWKLARELLEAGMLKPHPVVEKPGRLSGVLRGLQDMREGKVRGSKWVYRID